MIVGMSGALLQGARGVTEDIDVWFEDPNDPRIAEAVREAGGIWISGSFGLSRPSPTRVAQFATKRSTASGCQFFRWSESSRASGARIATKIVRFYRASRTLSSF